MKGDELTVEDYTVNPLTGQNHRRRVRLIEYVEASHGEAWINVVETYSRDGHQHSTGRVRSFGLSRVRQVHRKKKRVLSAKELRARRQQEAV